MTINTDNKIASLITPLPDSPDMASPIEIAKSWDQIMLNYKGNIQTIDLRSFDAAQAISAVSGELEYLHAKAAFLFLLNNHLPGLFLDKLVDDKFDYHIKIIAPGEVRTLIFRH